MMRILVPLLLAALLPGCALLGSGEADSAGPADPYAARDGPHFVLTLENVGPNAATIQMRVSGPGREGVSDTITVPAGAKDVRYVPLAGVGPQDVRIAYSWSAGSRAASGENVATFDSRQCGGAFDVSFRVDTTPEATTSGASAVCSGASA